VTGTSTGGPKLQPRDISLLHGLFDSRVFTLPHVASLYFDNSIHAARKRVQKLKRSKLLAERPRKVGAPSILFITARGIDALARRDLLKHYPPLPRFLLARRAQVSELTLRHELDVATSRVALTRAVAQRDGCELVELTTWPRLHEFAVERRRPSGARCIKPDGYLHVRLNGAAGTAEHRFFLEIDRSTESQRTIIDRVSCYREHYRSGGFAEALGRDRGSYRLLPFRVLFVFRNEERRNNAAAALLTLKPPVRTLVWMTTLSDLARDPLAAIWITPEDYARAVAGTDFDAAGRQAALYRRQVSRDRHIASTVRCRQLFSEAPALQEALAEVAETRLVA
jgi:hypothetical protein